MKILSSLLFWVCTCGLVLAQNNPNLVVAKQGDGIFSMLRKQGLDPVKHYEEFLILNEGKIKNGSFLLVGVEYQIPEATDSFKKTGVHVLTQNGIEEPIFDKELGSMSLKSEKLKDAVYYLIEDSEVHENNDFLPEITQNLASELMVHGAKVYILGDESPEILTENDTILTQTQKMGNYIEAINKRYIQNSGKYQRVLVIRAHKLTGKSNMNVAVYHYTKSEEGQRLAANIQNVFKKNNVSNHSFKDANMVFEDTSSLYLAKNILPAISLLTLENESPKSRGEKIAVRPDKRLLANMLTNGIMNDFADLEIEE